MMKRTALLAFAATLFPMSGQAQVIEADVVDRLVAVVGDSTVLYTQVVEEMQRRALGGVPMPDPESPEFEPRFREVLDEFVDRLLVLQAAVKDSLISVNEAEIEERVNEQITQLSQQFGGQSALQQALAGEGLTLAEYRDYMRVQARTENIQRLFFQLRLRDSAPVTVTEEEMLEAFEEARGSLQQRPKLITFRQVVVTPEPTEDSREDARVLAESLLERIKSGEDIAELATEYSDDPGTRDLGGDLGWFRRGRMVREFEDAAFGILEGVVDEVIATEYGFHVIEVERYRAGERSARHILVMPEQNAADVQRAREVAGEVAALARAGEPMQDLFAEYSDPVAPDSLTFPFDQIDQLPPAYGVIRTASAGEIVGPFEYQVGDDTQIAIVRVEEIREAGAFTFEDLRGQIAGALQQEKQMAQVVESLRASTYIEIRM